MTPLSAALGYAQRGWSVFPLIPGDKRPAVKWRDVSTTDPDAIAAWWEATPDAGIGVDTGKSKLVVIDVDDQAGLEQLESEIGKLPTTLTQRTGRGGQHFVYADDGAGPLRNSASTLADGVDVRADGGYIVVAPSVHPNGQQYEWTQRQDPITLPTQLRTRMTPPPKPAPEAPSFASSEGSTRWGLACLEAEAGRVAVAPDGRRNHTLFEAALKVYGAVKGGHLDRLAADTTLTLSASRAGLGDIETDKTLESAWATARERNPEERPEAPPALSGERPTVTRARAGLALLDLEELAKLPPPKWLIRNRLPEGFTVLYGPPAGGKTFVALDWALLVAATQDRPVLYLPGEGLSGLSLRIKAWRQKHPRLDPSRFLVSKALPRLLEPAGQEDLAEACAKHKPGLMVIDTLARTMVGGDENSSNDVGRVIAICDAMREEHDTSTLLLHHTLKGNEKSERGSGALRGAADCMWGLSRDEIEPWRIWLECSKLKDGAYPAPVQHMLDDLGGDMVALHPTTAEALGVEA